MISRTPNPSQVAFARPVRRTLSIYPESLKQSLLDACSVQGAQRIVSIAGAEIDGLVPTSQDGMELLRRMCRWIVPETSE
jgi:hypothetical protein